MVRGAEQAGLAALGRAGKRALVVAEQLAFHQVLRDGGEVHAHERAAGARRRVVDGLREQLLARAAFAGDQYGGVRLGIIVGQGHGVAQHGGRALDIVKGVFCHKALAVDVGARLFLGVHQALHAHQAQEHVAGLLDIDEPHRRQHRVVVDVDHLVGRVGLPGDHFAQRGKLVQHLAVRLPERLRGHLAEQPLGRGVEHDDLALPVDINEGVRAEHAHLLEVALQLRGFLQGVLQAVQAAHDHLGVVMVGVLERVERDVIHLHDARQRGLGQAAVADINVGLLAVRRVVARAGIDDGIVPGGVDAGLVAVRL